MNNGKIAWIFDRYKLRREGFIGALSEWADDDGVVLQPVERAEHIVPFELVEVTESPSQICVVGIGGQGLAEAEVRHTLRTLTAILQDRPLIVLQDDISGEDIAWARKLGLKGLVSTFLDTKIVVRAISHVFDGGEYFSEPVPAVKLQNGETDEIGHHASEPMSVENQGPLTNENGAMANGGMDLGKTSVARNRPTELSARQLEVLEALKRGLSNKLIARKLDLSEATVKVHMRTLIQKFGVENRTQVALLANDPSLWDSTRSSLPPRPSSNEQGTRQKEAANTASR